MKKIIALLVFLGFAISSWSQDADSLMKKAPKPYPMWMLYVPGATHFADGRIGMGLAFSTFEIGMVTTGLVFDKQLGKYSNSQYYNYPLFIGLNALAVDKCDVFRNQLEIIHYNIPSFKYDNMSFNELIKAPFQPKNIFTPITGGFIALALVELFLSGNDKEYSFKHMEQMQFMDRYISRNKGLAIYGAASMAMSWEAGVAEEYIFRNYLMPVLDYRMGQRKGLLISSGIFGGMHAFNYLFVERPKATDILYHITFASVMGYVLGKNVQNHNYKIGQAVAAHTWYDYTLMLGSFLINPRDNFLGVDMKFKF